MKTYLKFEKFGKDFWNIVNDKGETIGHIFYYHLWKQYVFETSIEFIFGCDCLLEIINFMKKELKT